jgi:hypothetical protein
MMHGPDLCEIWTIEDSDLSAISEEDGVWKRVMSYRLRTREDKKVSPGGIFWFLKAFVQGTLSMQNELHSISPSMAVTEDSPAKMTIEYETDRREGKWICELIRSPDPKEASVQIKAEERLR